MVETFASAGREVETFDLHATQFDPVSGWHNFIMAKDSNYSNQQIEEMHARPTALPLTSGARCKDRMV